MTTCGERGANRALSAMREAVSSVPETEEWCPSCGVRRPPDNIRWIQKSDGWWHRCSTRVLTRAAVVRVSRFLTPEEESGTVEP